VVGVAIRPGHRTPKLAGLVTGEGESLINAWVKIDENNKVTAIVPHSEMGQGAQTALSQMLADELDANWDDVSFMEAPAEDEYANWAMGKGYILGDTRIPKALTGTVDGLFLQITKAMHLQITGGSASVRTTGVYGMRVAGAAAKQMLVEAAADAWGVRARDITTDNGLLTHAGSGKQARYAEFAAIAGKASPPRSPILKRPEEFTIMGQSKPRLDIPAKVDGSALFGIDVVVDGMKYATVKAAPVFGATVSRMDAGEARVMPGVIDVINLDDAVAVVAEGYWQAQRAIARVNVSWSKTANDDVSTDSIFKQFENDIEKARATGNSNKDIEIGDATRTLNEAGRVVKRSYQVPYLAHACMEPMNAVARFHDGQCEVWTGSQNPLGFKHAVAEALEIDAEHVKLTNYFMGGGFGRRATPDAAIQAAKIA
ncbi:MAG: molybdopterin cofactor-binding domain-containing protein, partial [Pseudomonadales bacterium]